MCIAAIKASEVLRSKWQSHPIGLVVPANAVQAAPILYCLCHVGDRKLPSFCPLSFKLFAVIRADDGKALLFCMGGPTAFHQVPQRIAGGPAHKKHRRDFCFRVFFCQSRDVKIHRLSVIHPELLYRQLLLFSMISSRLLRLLCFVSDLLAEGSFGLYTIRFGCGDWGH